MIKLLSRAAAAASLALAAASLGACAGGARSAEMMVSVSQVPAVSAGQPGFNAFRVSEVSGGSDTNPMWMSNVSNADFRKALEDSLKATGHYADPPSSATYELSANLTGLQRPPGGFDMTTITTVRYKATPVGGGQPLIDEDMTARGLAKFGDSLIGTERLRIANENAVRENIVSFIKRLRTVLNGTSTKPIS